MYSAHPSFRRQETGGDKRAGERGGGAERKGVGRQEEGKEEDEGERREEGEKRDKSLEWGEKGERKGLGGRGKQG